MADSFIEVFCKAKNSTGPAVPDRFGNSAIVAPKARMGVKGLLPHQRVCRFPDY
jgi:hypothetical protein